MTIDTEAASPHCPACNGPITGVSSPNGRRRGGGYGSRGYCMSCHISLTKGNGEWARSQVVPLA
jgi:hypothetical protein